MKTKEISPGIFHISFQTKRLLTSTFLRFQEHYESPRFRGKIFTLGEFKAWYTRSSPKGKKTGRFTYYSDWSGFNIPSYILEPFYEGKFDPLSRSEKKILKTFSRIRHKKFYIIGTYGNRNKRTFAHEAAHALFYLKPEYKSEVLDVLKRIRPEIRKKINKAISGQGSYCKEVLEDETHAYILTLMKDISKNPEKDGLLQIQSELKSLLGKYSGIKSF